MDERLNHLNMILEAPEKVSVAYTMSVLASRCLGAIEEEFKKRGETLDKQKEAELKRIVDEGYNDPERLAKELAEAFGLK